MPDAVIDAVNAAWRRVRAVVPRREPSEGEVLFRAPGQAGGRWRPLDPTPVIYVGGAVMTGMALVIASLVMVLAWMLPYAVRGGL